MKRFFYSNDAENTALHHRNKYFKIYYNRKHSFKM